LTTAAAAAPAQQQQRRPQQPSAPSSSSRGFTTSAAPQAFSFHENLRGPNQDKLFTRDNYRVGGAAAGLSD